MKLDNFLALTKATLLNEPSIVAFEHICVEASKIKRGDAFFAYDKNEIQTALQNGAYVVVFEGEEELSDNEIAWVSVESLEYALRKVLRFKIVEKDISVYECNEIVLELATQLNLPPNFYIYQGDIKTNLLSLWNLEEKTNLLCCLTLGDTSIFATKTKLQSSLHTSIEIIEQTLFETSFIYKDKFYERQLLSPFFMPYLEDLFYFLDSINVEFKIKKFSIMEHFEAVFVNKKFEAKNFGTSDMVLIFEPKSDLVKNQIAFLKQYAPWANTIFVIPQSMPDKYEENVYIYTNKKEILDILKEASFHFALIVGCDKSILNNQSIVQKQLTFEF